MIVIIGESDIQAQLSQSRDRLGQAIEPSFHMNKSLPIDEFH